ncbi:MAG: hydrolase [Bacteroidia bacterium]|nr:hydrolase [Bacteroidia bacterium]MBT8268127.1 hydrolase [Bacteroidia bacterium]NNF81484.1 hydrolase [Flavobacteriaceae bacterium]NNK71486.1 hydrolase [Flavobacteriaceae bacterium]NNL81660.1 hydrolase [Flavobacteriaceae bacterium]
MKKQIFLYLFVFALLLVIFQFVNSKNIIEKYEVDIQALKKEKVEREKAMMKLEDENLDLLYFNLENNDDALSYFERDGLDTAQLVPFLSDELYKLNEVKGEHPLVPYSSMSGKPMLINKVRLLNHKWIITDFTDGEYWGEMLLKYEITENRELKFKVVESLLYPPQT